MNMRDDDYTKMRETGWRRTLTSEEKAALQEFLKAHPAVRRDWEEDAALTRVLQGWGAPPVSTNFTARLLLAAQKAPVQRTWADWFALEEWLPENRSWRVAMCSMALCVGLFSFHESTVIHRTRMARQLADVSRVAVLPRMEWLKNFDTIKGMSQTKVADDDLLTALQ
jgi:hypothetical protein